MTNKYIQGLISKMTLDQKVGAVLTLGFAGTLVRPHIYESILKYHCGGLRLTPHARLFGSYVDPKSGESIVNVVDGKGYKDGLEAPYATPNEYRQMLIELQEMALSRPLGIPLHFAFDQEGGTSADYNFGNVNIFPKPMGLVATGDSDLAYEVAKVVSEQSKAVGFNWIHSPVLDINTEPDNPEIYTRAYSDRVEDVIEYAAKSCQGFKDAKMITTGKHFPGRGHSSIDAHFEVPVIDVDKETMLKRELAPYKALIGRDLLPSIMIAHSIFPAIDSENIATVSKKILTGLLREELGYKGVIMTDSMTMGGIATRYGVANACALALEAGADLVLMKAENTLVEETIKSIKEFVKTGRITEQELDKKVYRVLDTKYKYGLFTKSMEYDQNPEEINKSNHITQLSKTIAKKSIIIAKNKNVLPLNKEEKMLIVEQINKTPNNMSWHPGILYKQCLKYNQNIEYLETEYTYDSKDKENILRAIKEVDTIVLTNFFIRGKLSNNEFLEELLTYKDKQIVIVTNTPYPISVPKHVENLVITFATSPDNIEMTAGVLFGEVVPEGTWPIAYKGEL